MSVWNNHTCGTYYNWKIEIQAIHPEDSQPYLTFDFSLLSITNLELYKKQFIKQRKEMLRFWFHVNKVWGPYPLIVSFKVFINICSLLLYSKFGRFLSKNVWWDILPYRFYILSIISSLSVNVIAKLSFSWG